MARTVSQNLALAHSGVDRIVEMYRKKRMKWYPLMTHYIDNTEAYYTLQTTSDLPPAIATNEATGIPFADIQTPYNLTLVPTKYSMGFSVSFESVQNDYYGVLAERGRWLGDSVEKAMDIDAAGFMINATNGSIVTPDRVAEASTAHLYSQGFFSNVLSNNLPLSAAALEQAIDEIITQPSHMGDPMNFVGPFDLWVAPAQKGLAMRLSGTTPNKQLPQTFNSDKDWGGEQIANVIVNPYWNSTPFAWMIVARDASNPFLWIENGKLRMPTPQYDMNLDTIKGSALSRWVKGVQDPRGFVFSAGS